MEVRDIFGRFTPAIWRSMIRDGRGQVRFPARDLLHELTLSVCTNPDCPCEVVTLSFRESDPLPRRAAEAFDVTVDLRGQEEPEIKGLGPQAEASARAVAGSLRGETRHRLRSALGDHRARMKRIPKTIAGYVSRGETVPYAHVAAGGVREDDSYAGFMDTFEAEDLEWQVLDAMCGASGCDCAEVHLTFFGGDATAELRFDAVVSLNGAPPRIEDLHKVTLARAKRIFDEWEATTPFDLPLLQTRYDMVRTLAKIGAEPAPTLAKPAVVAATGSRAIGGAPPRSFVVPPKGRREPCPCGSGKRYKNCCGAAER